MHEVGGSLEGSSAEAHTAREEMFAVAVPLANLLSVECKSRRDVVPARDRTAAGTCRVILVSASLLSLRGRVRRASIAFAGYRTPGLYSRNQPRTNKVLWGL